jgi:2-haloacid dehalogenase
VFPAHHNRWVTFDCYGTLIPRAVPAEAPEQGISGERRLAVRPFDDVEPLLAELRRRQYKLGVLTNFDDAQFESVHREFKQPFDLFVTADRIRAHKPELWHFRAFQRLAQVHKRDWVHVASDWGHDIVPAEAFGIQRVWLDRAGTGEDASRATAHVRSAGEVVKALDWMFQECAACAS